ncbi:MAG: radical SAM protein [Candidatus Hodarchaeota archaeon]
MVQLKPLMADKMIPRRVRVSVGTASVLGLIRYKYDVRPTTAYLMMYTQGGCRANCGFCPQARTSSAKSDMLSRVTWPAFSTIEVLESLKTTTDMKRVCIQALNYPHAFEDLLSLIHHISGNAIPISASIQPIERNQIGELRDAGLERIGIPVDAATPKIFRAVKGKDIEGPYEWRSHIKILDYAVRIFGERKVSTHLIIGLGETEEEAIEFIQMMSDLEINSGLFAFTPIKGTRLGNRPQPPIDAYRRIQIGRYLIVNGLSTRQQMIFDSEGRLCDFGLDSKKIGRIVKSGKPFLTSGCPGCNRPYYNERPGGLPYNYPRPPLSREIEEIRDELKIK